MITLAAHVPHSRRPENARLHGRHAAVSARRKKSRGVTTNASALVGIVGAVTTGAYQAWLGAATRATLRDDPPPQTAT